MTDIDKLKALAGNCHPSSGKDLMTSRFLFQSAANPAAVLELIAEIELLREECEAHLELIGKQGAAHMHEKLGTFDEYQNANASLANERDQLKTENTDLHATLHAAKGEIERIKGENEALRRGMKGDYDLDAWLDWAKEAEALRKDAQRYRFVLDCPIRTMVALSRKAHEADFDLSAECDMLMSKESSHG